MLKIPSSKLNSEFLSRESQCEAAGDDTTESEDLPFEKSRNSLPNTGTAKINRHELRKEFSRSSVELDRCIADGGMPIFGYPGICYSPLGALNDRSSKKDKFWHKLFLETVKNPKEGKQSSIVKCLDQYDVFKNSQKQLFADFSRGKYNVSQVKLKEIKRQWKKDVKLKDKT